MNLLWRFIWVYLLSRFSTRVNFFDECHLSLRVLPTDIDILGHMNNGRYLSLMDLGRLHYLIRCGIFQKFAAHNVYPVIASEMIRFKKSLLLFQKFDLATRLVGWDDKFFYIAQRFMIGDELYALSLIKTRFLIKKKGPISPKELLNIVGLQQYQCHDLPEWVTLWNQSDQSFYADIMNS